MVMLIVLLFSPLWSFPPIYFMFVGVRLVSFVKQSLKSVVVIVFKMSGPVSPVSSVLRCLVGSPL